jgi:hypothetical protein
MSLYPVRLQKVFHRIVLERDRQDRLKVQGRFKYTCADETGLSPSQKYTVLGEEMGEVARVLLNLNDLATDFSNAQWDKVALIGKLQKELTEVAAVACAWLESLESIHAHTEPIEPKEGIQL